MLILGSTYELAPFNVQVNTDIASLVTTITYPAGVAYHSHTLTAGVFTSPTWAITNYQRNVLRSLTITVEITDVAAFTALAMNARIVTGLVTSVGGEVVLPNNTFTKSIDEETCLDLLNCSAEELPEYSSMALAIAALGDGRPFLASLGNIEGWSYRALIVTPFP